jgi:hypothetical protein
MNVLCRQSNANKECERAELKQNQSSDVVEAQKRVCMCTC